MKKIMILGSEKYFENLVMTAKEKGIYTIVCDKLNDTPAKKIADEVFSVDVFDYNSLIKIGNEKAIDGVITGFTDILMQPYVTLANKLDLPCVIKPEQLEAITNKQTMKSIFEKNNIKTSKYIILANNDEINKVNKLRPPYIIKPLDSSGSKGVYVVADEKELIDKLNISSSYSTNGKIIVEEFYEGDEIQGLGWVHEGEAHVIYIGDRELVTIHEGRPGKPRRLYYPSKHLYQYEDEIKSIYQQIVDGFKIKNGPLYVQMLVGNEGIKVNEAMTRLPGGCDYLGIKEITGYDIGKLIIDFATNEKIDFEELKHITLKNKKKNLFVIPIYLKAGVVEEIHGIDKLKEYEWIKEIFWDIEKGYEVEETGDMKQDCGRLFCLAENRMDARKKIGIIYHTLKILDKQGQMMIDNFIV